MLPWILAGVCVMIAVILLIRNILIQHDLRNLTEQIEEKLNGDTNVSLYITGRNKYLRQTAGTLNAQLNQLRKQQIQFQHGNAELKNAVTNISHDLRTPLTAICGYLDMMENADAETRMRYLRIMKERAELMKHLTEEMFRYSVILSEKPEVQNEKVCINQVLEDSIMGFYAALSERGIVPEVHLTEKRITANLNKEQLSRIFSNLLNNALKYSGGDLSIVLSDSGEISFSNIAKELSAVKVEQLFDRFYTVDSAHHSTGLGLSIARTLAERMGGTISAEYAEERLSIRLCFSGQIIQNE